VHRIQFRFCILLLAVLLWSESSSAFVLTINPGPKQLFMMVGVGATSANNATINLVSVSIPPARVGDGVPVTMTSDSTQSINPYAGYTLCSAPAQIYIAGMYRQPDASTGTATATLQVTTPPALTSGADTLPFSQISWSSTGGGTIPSGSFNGGTLLLANIARNSMVDNCLAYTYRNTAVVPAGTFNGRAVFTLVAP
jgi:hypothetical protein